MFRWDGHVTGADAPSAAALRLSQKNRLAELQAEAELARDVLAEAEDRLAVAAEAIRAGEGRLSRCPRLEPPFRSHLGDAREALAAAERASGDLIRRRAVVAEAASQLHGQIEDVAIQDENARIELEDAPDLSAIELRNAPTAAGGRDRSRPALAEARARHDGLNRENDARQRRLLAIGAGAGHLAPARGQRRRAYPDAARPRRRSARGGRRASSWPPTNSTTSAGRS